MTEQTTEPEAPTWAQGNNPAAPPVAESFAGPAGGPRPTATPTPEETA